MQTLSQKWVEAQNIGPPGANSKDQTGRLNAKIWHLGMTFIFPTFVSLRALFQIQNAWATQSLEY